MSKPLEEFLKEYQEQFFKQQYARYLEYKAKPSQKARKNKQVAATEAIDATAQAAAAPPAAPISDNGIIAPKKRGRKPKSDEAVNATPIACAC